MNSSEDSMLNQPLDTDYTEHSENKFSVCSVFSVFKMEC
jgi:hypothetical protein